MEAVKEILTRSIMKKIYNIGFFLCFILIFHHGNIFGSNDDIELLRNRFIAELLEPEINDQE